VTATYASAFDRIQTVVHHFKANSTDKNKARALCPGHNGTNKTTLAITQVEGKILLYCHVGCTLEQILDAIGWTKSDLYDDRSGYTYTYQDGANAHRSYNGDGKKKFYQSGNTNGNTTSLYRLDRVEVAKLAGQTIYLVEGEDDAHALEHLGVCATTTRGGVGMMGKADLSPLYGARVVAVVDKDTAGAKWANYMRTMLTGKTQTLTFVQAKTGKDAADHVASDHGIGDFDPYQFPEDAEPEGRWVDLGPFLDGTYTPEEPSIGAIRDDGIPFIYPGRWHTVIGLMTAGKTFFALWHVKHVLESGGHVVYIHFEEPQPAGTIQRLLQLGVDKEVIRKRFHWPTPRPWTHGEIAAEIETLPTVPALAVLDGINAACGNYRWDVTAPASVGLYRVMFVHPLTSVGTAVLSLGHPPKATNRQNESYGYGAAGWSNDVDGVSLRMNAGSTPISKGSSGSSAIYVVKDRYCEVQRWGVHQSDKDMPW
jgi:5S rRNA maturation endonuclease (ribonuclease M5)